MKMIPCDKYEIMERRPRSNNFAILQEFVNSEHDCVELEDFPHRDALLCTTSLSGSVKRYGFRIRVKKVGDEVYLIKM